LKGELGYKLEKSTDLNRLFELLEKDNEKYVLLGKHHMAPLNFTIGVLKFQSALYEKKDFPL
jgi:hypothetical protein